MSIPEEGRRMVVGGWSSGPVFRGMGTVWNAAGMPDPSWVQH